MNNMKKALALVMSLALAASTFVVGAAYDDVPENHENRIAINLLGDLGVMVGDAGTNDFRPDGTLKRSEAAAIVYRLRTGKTNADSYVGSTGFSDVSDSHWASGYINYCVEQGIIAGYPDGTFKPDQEVTYAEYIKMVVCALNLQKVETTTYIDMNTGVLVSEDKITTNYPNGYIVLASDQQINEGIDYLSPNDKISRAEVAQGAYNAIFESYYKLDPKDADYVKDDGENYQHLAGQVFKLTRAKGVVTAYEDYTAAGQGTQEANHFYLENVDSDHTGAGEYEYADFDASWIGQEVYVWEKGRNGTSATEPKVVAVVATEDNTVTTINANDLKKDGSDLYYTDVNGKKQTLKAADLGTPELILNGKTYTRYNTSADVWTMLRDLAEKRVPVNLTFIDNNNSGKSPEYIKIDVYTQTEITSVTNSALYVKNIEDTYSFNEVEPDTSVVGSSDDSGRLIYEQLVADVDKDATADVYDLNAGRIDLLNDDDTVNDKIKYYDGIAKGDKVMIYADANGNYDIRKIEEVEGTITLMSGSKYKIDDQELYIVAGDAMKDLMDTNLNSDVLVYIDPFTGYIIYATEGTGNVSDYYYVHLIQKQYATSSDYQLLAYDYEGNKVTLTFRNSDVQSDVLDELGYDPTATGSTVNGDDKFDVIDRIGIFDVNSKGQITGWRNNNTESLTKGADYDKDAEYNTKTGYVTIENKRVEIKPSTVVFGVTFEDDSNKEKIDEVKTYVGSFPKTTNDVIGNDNDEGVDYYLRKNDDDLKVALIRGKTKGGNTEFTNVTGYVLSETFEYTDKENKKGFATYKIATKGEIKEYQTEVVDDTDLLDILGKTHLKKCMIKFDLTTDGKIVYSDKDDIEIMDGNSADNSTNAYTFEQIVKQAQAAVAGRAVTITADPLAAFGTDIHPGNTKVDEDEIYYGIVVEGKDEKFMQLVNLNGQSIIVDYADDVKVYNIEDGKWDTVEVGTTGNITDSNTQYTTYAAVRIVDGDDVNDARITEVYAYTTEDTTFNWVDTNQRATDETAPNVVNGFTVYGGTTSATPTPTPEGTQAEQDATALEGSVVASAPRSGAAQNIADIPEGATISGISVTDANGDAVADTVVKVTPNTTTGKLEATIATTAPVGEYTVNYTLTAADETTTEGSFTLTVAPTTTEEDKFTLLNAQAAILKKAITIEDIAKDENVNGDITSADFTVPKGYKLTMTAVDSGLKSAIITSGTSFADGKIGFDGSGLTNANVIDATSADASGASIKMQYNASVDADHNFVAGTYYITVELSDVSNANVKTTWTVPVTIADTTTGALAQQAVDEENAAAVAMIKDMEMTAAEFEALSNGDAVLANTEFANADGDTMDSECTNTKLAFAIDATGADLTNIQKFVNVATNSSTDDEIQAQEQTLVGSVKAVVAPASDAEDLVVPLKVTVTTDDSAGHTKQTEVTMNLTIKKRDAAQDKVRVKTDVAAVLATKTSMTDSEQIDLSQVLYGYVVTNATSTDATKATVVATGDGIYVTKVGDGSATITVTLTNGTDTVVVSQAITMST